MAEKPNSKSESVFQPLQLALNLGYMIALPLVILALVGRYLDKIYQTSPIFLLIGLFIAFGISCYYVYRKVIKIYSNLEITSSKDKNSDKKDK
ncbi:MAG: AtpZ/AtpI family protein [Patescibacteria group bacterium]